MKIIYEIFIAFCLFSIINSLCQIDEGDEELSRIREKSDCNKRALSEEEVRNGGYRCCFMKQKVSTLTFSGKIYSCLLVTSAEFDNIKNIVEKYEDVRGTNDVSINCKSTYLQFGLLIFSLLLF